MSASRGVGAGCRAADRSTVREPLVPGSGGDPLPVAAGRPAGLAHLGRSGVVRPAQRLAA
ncbi:MAG: hypothetical protein ACRCZD_20865 [Phycicoccus sp.]